MTDSACIFCEIVARRSPSSVVYEDDLAIAFLDINPVTPGHTLVVPRAHSVGILDMDDEIATRLLPVARRVAQALTRTGLRADGVNLFLADGEAAGQDVFHSHLHVIPRFEGDGFIVRGHPPNSPPTRAMLDTQADQIRHEIETTL